MLTINGQRPREQDKFDRIEYSVTWSLDEAPEEFVFLLERQAEGDEVQARVTRPAVFDILTPTPRQEIPRSQDMELTWDPPDPTAQILIQMDDEIGIACLDTDRGEHDYMGIDGVWVPDSGSRVIPAGAIRESLPTDPSGACDATVTLTRANEGEYPGVLERGGWVEARSERSVTFVSVR